MLENGSDHQAVAHPEFARARRADVVMFEHPLASPGTIVLAHPLLWAFLGAILFFVAWSIPASAYERYFEDRNYLFLDLPTFLFTSGCVTATLVGLYMGMTGNFASGQVRSISQSPLEGAPLTTIGLFVVLAMMNLSSVALFLKVGGLGAFRTALSGQGDFIHTLNQQSEEGGLSGKLWIHLIAMSSVLLPVLWVIARNHRPRSMVRWLFWLFVGTYLLAAIFGGKRNFIARPLFGVMLIYLVWPSYKLTLSRALTVCGGALAVMILVFVAASAVRDDVRGIEDATSIMARYMLAPYNTEALLVNEHLTWPGERTGGYWFEWFWDFPIFDRIFGLADIREDFLGEAPPLGATDRGPLLGEHGVTASTNITAFGASYVDFGWMGILPFFLVGWIGGILWKRFLLGTIAGLLFYPQFAYSMIEWRSNIIFPGNLTDLALVALLLIGTAVWLERPRVQRAAATSRGLHHRFRAIEPEAQTPASQPVEDR